MTRLDLPVRVPLSVLLFVLSAVASIAQVAPSSPVREDAAVELSPFTITTDADDGYAATESASASRFRQKLKDIPQSISILSGEFLKDVAANDLEDIVPMLGGTVSSGTRQQDSFTIRGFAVQETYLDGMRDVQEWGGGDFAHVQQVEIIKGPSSNLFANPKGLGGTINRVSKMPLDRRWHQVGLGYGSFDSFHFTVDTTGPLNEAKSLLYRANLAYRQIGYNRDFKETERFFFAPVVEWRITGKTKLTFFGEILRQDYQEDNWIPTSVNPDTGLREVTVPDTRRIDEPWAQSRIEKEKARLIAEHTFNPNLVARVVAQQTYINNPIEQVEFLSLAADRRTVNRRAFWLNRWEDYRFVEANLFGRYQVGRIEHSFIFAADNFHTEFRSNVRRAPLASIDLLNPVYNTPRPDFPASGAATNTRGDTNTSGWSGTYQLNALEGRIILIGGWRDSRVKQTRRVELGEGPFPLIEDPSTTAENPRYGAIVRPLRNLAVYYQYSEAFQPIGGAALRLDGSPLDPITGSSEEFGVRLNFLGEKLNLEVVNYEVVANGLGIRLPPPNNSFFENGGQNTGKGYEYTLTYHDDRLTVRAGWVTVDVRDTTPGVLGEQVAGQPPERGQLHVRYRFPNVGRHGGLAIGAGLVHVGDRPVTTSATAQKIPSFETYSLNARYNLAKDFVVALAVNNLTDVRRVVSNSGSAIFRPSNPRTFQLSLTKSW